jgi:hypothetical protein
MRSPRLTFALLMAAVAALPLVAQQNRVSPHETFSTVLGERSTGNRITITYGRPYTKSPKTGEPRKIWGGLVPWDAAYRLGADEATLLTLQNPLVIGGAAVPAGAYTLYLVPSETGASKLGISTTVGQWGDPVDEAHDLVRVDAAKEALASPVSQLTLAVEKDASGGGTLKIMWESTGFSVPIKPPAPHVDFPAASPAATVKQRIGLTDIEVVYSRPSLRGRVMIGGIDPYGVVWRTGANNATRITFSTRVTLQGAPVAAGTYELFTIPEKDEWTLILQKPTKQWGSYAYDPKNDVVRVKAKAESLAEPVETFTIGFNNLLNESGTLNLKWGRVTVPFAVEVEDMDLVVPQIEAVMASSGKKPYAAAAVFYSDHNRDLKTALGWIDAAIAENPKGFYLVYQKARILQKMGDKTGAEAAARQSIDLASQSDEPAKSEYRRLNEALIAGLK